jgi:Domain of unknown function (DUF4214)/Subtilase family
MKRWLYILPLVLILAGSSAEAQTGKDGPMAKLTHSLVAVHEQYSVHQAQRSAAPFSVSDPLIRLVGDRVVIDAVASGDVDVLKADLVFLGMQEAVAFDRIVSGQLPISAIPAVAALPSLRFAQSAAAMTNAGNVTSQGDQAMRSDAARTTFGVDGTGVTVGVLSDSFNCLGGASADVASDDLSPVNVISEISSCTGATDEGRAMLQIVHDIAPGASLAFATAFDGQASFAANIQALATAGAKVIVDDTFYFAEPMFQDGIIAQAVDSVVAGGVAYFSAAGNQAQQSYQSVFTPGNSFADGAIPSAPGAPHFSGGTAHNFNSSGSSDHFQSITIPGLTTVTFILQWDSPFFSVSGSPGTQNDLDLYLLDASATQVLAGSAFNNVGGDAVEVLGVRNNGAAPVTVNLMIVKHSGADPGLIKYIRVGSVTVNEFDMQSSTVFGHPNAVGAEAVGAARYTNTPGFGVSPPVLESFSSSGGTPILFDLAGNRLATPDPRAIKPEIVAPDGVDTTFFGSPDFDGTGFLNFFGTSAAAPHAAAVAALLLQSKPALTPAKIYESLEATAIDMGTSGFDNDSGFGLIQADAAVEAAITESPTFVRQQYLDFLDREPDSGGLAAWVNALDGGLPKSSLIEAFMNSAEFRFKGKFIAQVYLGILGRDADYGGFRFWLDLLLAGMSREQIVQGFLSSGEFQANFGSSLTNGQFVERMYNNVLLRASDTGGFNFWVGQLTSGQMTRAQVALSFLDSDEFQNLSASQNRVNASLLYFDMLQRGPDAGGFSAWVGALNSGVPLTSVIDVFLNSPEYQSRF